MCNLVFESIKYYRKFLILFSFSLFYNFGLAQKMDSTDVESYHLYVDFTNFKTQKLFGVAEIKCKPAFLKANKNVVFMLLRLKVDSVLLLNDVTSNFVKVNYTYNDTFLTIPNEINKSTTFKIFYQGTPIKDVSWGGFYFSGNYAYNMGVGFVSNPHNYGRVWYPCIDNFTDKALYSYSIKVPKGFAAVCGGLFKDTIQNNDNTTTWNWVHTNPIPTYLASVAVAPYKLVYDNFLGINRTIPIIIAAETIDTSNLIKSFANLKKAMTVFENFYGPYRFERVGYSLVPFDAGAMEHACNIAYPHYAADGKLTNETLMAHELSHHWWGNNMTCKTAGDMWLNEGWASYSEALFTEYVYGKKAYQDYINTIHKGVLQFAHLADGASTAVNNVSHNNTYGRHVYKKGADMVHCIRGVMGDEAFKEKCKSFMETYKMSNATTLDFSNHFNIPNDYVKQIISDTGFAHFSIYNTLSVKETNSWKNTITYKQKKRFGNHVYKNMPYEVFAFDKNFKKQVIKMDLGSNDVFTFNTNFKPELVCFDYDQKFSDAITDDIILTNTIGTHIFNYSMATIDIMQNTDTSLIRIEHNWVYPDGYFMNIPNVVISKERYWKIDGIFDPSLKGTITFSYDGLKPTNFNSGWLDNQLLEGRTEDSIVLLYRPNAESYWQIETNSTKTIGIKTDKRGIIKVNELKKGEYAFGVRGKVVTSGYNNSTSEKLIKIYPNPVDATMRIEWTHSLTPLSIKIFNNLGQNVSTISPNKNTYYQSIDISQLAKGNYFATVFFPDLLKVSSEFIISR